VKDKYKRQHYYTPVGFSFEVLTKEIRSFPNYFIMGLFLAYAYNRDGYILASVLMHVINNTIAVILICI